MEIKAFPMSRLASPHSGSELLVESQDVHRTNIITTSQFHVQTSLREVFSICIQNDWSSWFCIVQWLQWTPNDHCAHWLSQSEFHAPCTTIFSPVSSTFSKTHRTPQWTLHIQYHATRALLAAHDKRIICNFELLWPLWTNLSSTIIHPALVGIPIKWAAGFRRHGYSWNVAKDARSIPIYCRHQVLLLEVNLTLSTTSISTKQATSIF